MASYGMTPQGFVPKRLAEIQYDINERMADIVDPETNEFPFQNGTDDTVLQQIVGVFSEALAECWNAAYVGSVQFDPLKNTGAGQSGTVQLNAMLRKPGSATLITLALTGNGHVLIPKGSLVATQDNAHTYALQENVLLSSDGTGVAVAQETTFSEFDPPIGSVVRIVTLLPGGGWKGVTNTGTESVGTVEENDEILRTRQQRSTSLTSYRLIEAIYASVYNVSGVLYCRAYQNADTYPVDSRGIPFKEVAVVAEGGSSREIAEALFLRLPTGQIGYGSTTEVFKDSQGISYPISFSRPLDVDIYVHVTLTITEEAAFPGDGIKLIQDALVQFAQYGGTGLSSGFPPGLDIIRSRLYTPVNSIAGHSVTELTIGTSESALAETDIAIGWNEVGRFDAERITVTIL